jgi:hypothetical protein
LEEGGLGFVDVISGEQHFHESLSPVRATNMERGVLAEVEEAGIRAMVKEELEALLVTFVAGKVEGRVELFFVGDVGVG